MLRTRYINFCLATLLLLLPRPGWAQPVQLRLDTSAAEAVLTILDVRASGGTVSNEAWERLFASEPYRRLKQREADMQRSFTNEEFRAFVLSDELLPQAADLRAALDEWSSRDLDETARQVLSYLPADATIRATVYPMIKPRTNSFVYDTRGDPAIFLHLDPNMSPEVFENTVAHELHHIGFASLGVRMDTIGSDLPVGARAAVDWMGSFGEGLAMLAAAGGPDVHPHAHSSVDDRARWDRDMRNFNDDLRALEAFFLDLVDETTTEPDEIRTRAMSFFGVQGPWYTVGYRMAQLIEQRFGRAPLIDAMTDPRKLLLWYNDAAADWNATAQDPIALWSPRLLEAIGSR